jgi:Fe-S-cluster containining protein
MVFNMAEKLYQITPSKMNGHAGTANGAADRREVADGFRYAHFRADANTGKLLEIASFLYAAIDLLNKKGLLDLAELDEHKKQAAANLVEKFAERGMGVVYQKPEYDKYAFEGETSIDCENRVHLCRAACCKLRFALSKQDVEEGIVSWDFSAPYLIARGAGGYCQHLDSEKKCCSVHAHRPTPCRAYDCRQDKRIWLDFENMRINPEIDDPDWPASIAEAAKGADAGVTG